MQAILERLEKLMSCFNGTKHTDSCVCFVQNNQQPTNVLENFLCASCKRFGSSIPTLFPVCILFLHHCTVQEVCRLSVCVLCFGGIFLDSLTTNTTVCVCLGYSKRLWQLPLGLLFSKEGGRTGGRGGGGVVDSSC